MGISLDQYRARIGSYVARSCKSKDTYDTVVLEQFPDVDTTSPIMIRVSWKASSLGLLLILLCALCQSQLLLMGGVEPHPGPTAEETSDKRATVITELVVKAESDTVKDVIRRYKPTMTQNQLQKAFEGVHTKELVETMIFLEFRTVTIMSNRRSFASSFSKSNPSSQTIVEYAHRSLP